ncbi:MAG TPA: hypothetical protein VG942_08340 [Hyphomonadaceae bacterium]|nr:hypothetical protein [Hyphomonadaceae bacterium]
MTFTVTNSTRRMADHFEPEAQLSPQEQRALRGHLEQIDYAAFAANREVMSQGLQAEITTFEKIAVSAALARRRWVETAIAVTKDPHALNREEVDRLTTLRQAWEELSEVYEAMRRMVERGYLAYRPKA